MVWSFPILDKRKKKEEITLMERLIGKTLTELKAVAVECGLKPFAGKQLAEWIYDKRVQSIDDMTNISVKGREFMKAKYEVGFQAPVQSVVSTDGTIKYLFQTQGGLVESVFIPEEDRATLCISCQVGCKMNCLFCMTGKQGFSANLAAADIINQIMGFEHYERLTNIVFMGMGEPLDNLLEVLKTDEIMTSQWGAAWSPRRITLSSIGLVPAMREFIDKSQSHLAISLHNPFGREREEIMPIEKKYGIEHVIEAIKKYDWEHQRRVSFEYIMFEGRNDSPRHAAELARLLKGFTCRVNLIKFHSIPDVDLKSPSRDKMEWFRDYLTNNGVICTIRRSRGEDILAACGLLSSNNQ